MSFRFFLFVRIVTLCSFVVSGCSKSRQGNPGTDAGLDAAFDVPRIDVADLPDVGPDFDGGADAQSFDAGRDSGSSPFECWEGSGAAPAVQARRELVVDTYHGEDVEDPYRWMESGSAELSTHIEQSQVVTEAHLAPMAAAQTQRLEELRRARDLVILQPRGEREFFEQRPEGEGRRVVYVREAGAERVLIDPNGWDDEVTLGQWSPSPDGRFVLFFESMNNSDAGVIFVVDVESGEILDGGMMSPRLNFFAAAWALDSSGFYYWTYGLADATQYYHVLNTGIGEDINVSDTPVGRGSVVEAREGTERLLSAGNRLYRQDLSADPRSESVYELLVDPRSASRGFRYTGDSTRIYANEQSYVNPRGAVWIADEGPADGWEVLIPPGDGALLSWAPFGAGAAAVFVENGATVVRAYGVGGLILGEAPIPDFGSASVSEGSAGEVVIYFEGLFDSPRLFRWNPSSGSFALMQSAERAVSLPRADYQAEVLSVAGRRSGPIVDPRVYVPLVSPAGAPMDGSTPTMVNAYGGFAVPFTPRFSPRHALWLENGGAVAIPQLRGGLEQGLGWWAEATFERKQVTFDDLYQVVEELSASGLTGPDHLVLNGGSNGGLTMSVAITQRPELFAAAAIEAPLTDMLRYHLSGTGWAWVDEYGSSDIPTYYEALRRYSPFHVAEDSGCVNYPATIVMTGRADDRVVPWHAYKLAATLAEHTTARPTVLYTAPTASHAGSAFDEENLATDMAMLSFVAEASGLPLFE